MRIALEAAREAALAGEVPVGAVVVDGNTLVATGSNAPLARHDPTAHAEVMALREAARAVGNYRLDGCTLYVTLEPCAMCAGAMLHARLARVVFGASDPKTGAAGSVVNLFAEPRLNHQTAVTGGVLDEACSGVLRDFFVERRAVRRQQAVPLREDALRTPESCFAECVDTWPEGAYFANGPALGGLRLHYRDTGAAIAQRTWLLVHGTQDWSYQWRHVFHALRERGERVVAPDLIGFGRSDKPKKEAVHRVAWHHQVLCEWVQALDLRDIVLVVPAEDWLLALPAVLGRRCRGLLVVPSPPMDAGAGQAPFPDRGYRAAQRAFASVGNLSKEDQAMLAEFWHTRWHGIRPLVVGLTPPVLAQVQVMNPAPAFTLSDPVHAQWLVRHAVEYFSS